MLSHDGLVTRRQALAGISGSAAALGLGVSGVSAESDSDSETEKASLSTPFSPALPRLRTREYDLATLPFEKWPQLGSCRFSADEAQAFEGVATHTFEGDTGAHIVLTARRITDLLACHRDSDRDDSVFLDAAMRTGEALLDHGVERAGAVLFPYTFDYYTANRSYSTPWFSGMGQGIALSAFTQLASHVGESQYRRSTGRYWGGAIGAFLSLTQFRDSVTATESGATPWVVLEEDGYYWVEEYPEDPPDHTLNGMNFALKGIYEYWRATHSWTAEYLLQAGIATIEDHLTDFRVQNEYSHYCLKHGVQDEHYHRIHVEQLGQLYRLSGDETFGRMQSLFKRDGRRV